MKKKQNEQNNDKKSIVVDVDHKYNEELGEETNYNDIYRDIDMHE